MSVSSVRRRCAALTTAATVLAGCLAVLGLGPAVAEAAAKVDLFSPTPPRSEDFGGSVLVLSNGNYVVVDAFFDHGSTVDAGAVYLYDGTNNQLISTLNGLTAGDQVGLDGVTEVGTSDFVVLSASWHDGQNSIGAVTWVNGTTGLNGPVTTGNSLLGSHDGDLANSSITELATHNFVVASPSWDKDEVSVDVGAVTFADSVTGRAGQKIGAANSLVGTSAGDNVGSGGVTPLTDDKYAVASPNWDAADPDVGAVTWVNGDVFVAAQVDSGNSLVGSTDSDHVGSGGVTFLTNGNYVVSSPQWDNGSIADVGAVTWADGEALTSDTVSSDNSLIGTTAGDSVGDGGVTALTNDRYVVSSPVWDDDPVVDVGAVTLVEGIAPTSDAVSVSNSLVGNIDFDNLGIGGVTALTNGNYVVSSPFFSAGARAEAGAATWVNGAVGAVGPLNAASSLVGATDLDHVGSGGITALTNGNYVVSSPDWDSANAADVGAVTWAVGNSATPGTVNAANSLVGTTAQDPGGLRTADNVGSGGVTALTDGNYVVSSPFWNGTQDGVGAVTWASGNASTHVAVTAQNSLVGTRLDDNIGSREVKALVNGTAGRYVVVSDLWDNGTAETAADAGAATFGPVGGIVGSITPFNSAIGTPGVLLGDVRSASDLVTTDNAIVIATAQNRVLLLQLDDVLPPILGPMPTVDPNTTNAPGTGSKLVTFATPTATDNRGVPSVVCVPASGSLFPIGVTTVTCTATDGAGLTDVDSFTVTVNDVDPPVLHDRDNINVFATPGSTTQAVTFSLPTANDNDHVQSVVCDKASGSVFPLGNTTVHCIATDAAGLTDTGSFTVTVTTDSQPPVVNSHANVTAAAPPGAAGTAVTFAAPTASDNRGIQSVVCDPASGNVFPVGVTTVTCTATDLSGLTASKSFTVTVTAGVAAPAYSPLSGARLADTRPGQPTVDSRFAGLGIRPAGSILELTVADRGGVAADATAVALNVTAVGGTGDGYVTVFPCGSDQPTASNLNFTAGAVIPNAVIAKIGTAGKVCLFVSVSTHLVVDVSGYFPLGTSLQSLNPARVLDTRTGQPTFDGQQQGIGKLGGGTVTAVQITGRASVPADASAVVLNVTVTDPQAPGFVTVFPCGATIPNASNLNYVAGATVANLMASKIGDGGTVCVYTSQGTDLIVDVAGFFPAGNTYSPLVPARLLDTRATGSTIDGQFVGGGVREAGEVTELTVTNRGGVPVGVGTVVLNVTVTEPSGAGYVTVYPCGVATPLASNLNFEAGTTAANAVIVKVGTDGKVCLFNSKSTQLIVDVNGFFPSG